MNSISISMLVAAVTERASSLNFCTKKEFISQNLLLQSMQIKVGAVEESISGTRLRVMNSIMRDFCDCSKHLIVL